METFQDYLRKMQAYNSQRAITGPMVDTNNPYGPPELLSSYLEGQSASEARSRQLAIQEKSERNQEKMVAGQQRAEKYQLGALGVGMAGYGLMNADKLKAGYNTAFGGGGETALETPFYSTPAQPAIGMAGEGSTFAGLGEAGAVPETAIGETGAEGLGLGPVAAVPALALGARYATQKVLGSDTTKNLIKDVAQPFFDPIGTAKDAGHTISNTWKKITGWF